MPFPILAAAIPGATLLALLIARKRAASPGPDPTPPPPPPPTPGKKNIPPVPWPDPLPPTPFPATVIVPITAALPNGGLYVRTGPSKSSPYAVTKGAPETFTGRTYTVLETGIPASDGSGGQWWKVQTASGGVGYSRALDPDGHTQNFNVGAGGGGGGGQADNGGDDHGDDDQPDVQVAGLWYGMPAARARSAAAWRQHQLAYGRHRRWSPTRMKG